MDKESNENTVDAKLDSFLESNSEKQNDTEFEKTLKESNFNIKNLEDLYKQNLILKQQIDRDRKILKKARENFEIEIQQKYKELNEYKSNMNSIIEKNKKELIIEQDELSKNQEILEKARRDFENLKKRQQTNFKLKREKQTALLATKKSELETIEMQLKVKKEQIDTLRRELEFDIMEFEAKKREFTSNLEKFNSLVSSLGKGMDRIKEQTEL